MVSAAQIYLVLLQATLNMVLYVLSRFLKMEDIETDLGNEYFSKVLRLTLRFIISIIIGMNTYAFHRLLDFYFLMHMGIWNSGISKTGYNNPHCNS